MLEKNTVYLGDCLELMRDMEDHSVDLILCDLPYGSTRCKWDSPIDLSKLWVLYRKVLKGNGCVVLTATQPFASFLVISNISWFKYEWIWDKKIARGHLVAKKRPMAQHENILVFYKDVPTYNPQMVKRDKPIKIKEYKRTEIMGGESKAFSKIYTEMYPKTIQLFLPTTGRDKVGGHPTQKPVELFEYLIKTYTNEGDLVLDNCAGSGTTAVAAINSKRNWLLIEKDEEYYNKSLKRIEDANRR
jgi:site-specific DNA-methyltransferase (adenine-specific)